MLGRLKIYPAEFAVGLEAWPDRPTALDTALPETKGFTALHLVNAQLNDEMHNTPHITRVMQEILNLVKYHFAWIKRVSPSYHRFTHLKFSSPSACWRNYVDSDDDSPLSGGEREVPRVIRLRR